MKPEPEMVVAERARWIAACRHSLNGGGGHGWDEPEIAIFERRIKEILDEMEERPPQLTVEAERNIWRAIMCDVSCFPDLDDQDTQNAIYELANMAEDVGGEA